MSELLAILLTLTLIVASFISYIIFTIYKNYKKVSHIPGKSQLMFSPLRIPIIAPVSYIGNERDMIQYAKQYGDKETNTFRITTFFKNVITFSDQSLVKEIYVTKASYFSKPKDVYESFNAFGENILSVLDNEDWKKHHKICAPAFSIKSLANMCNVAANSADLLREQKWNKALEENGQFQVDLGDYSDTTLDVLGKAGFGIDFSIFSIDAEGSKFRHSLEVFIQKDILLRRFFQKRPFLLNAIEKYLGVDQHLKYIDEKLEEVINKRQEDIKEDKMEDNDLLSLLVEANAQEGGLLTQQEIKSNAAIFALAGHETTSTLLQWTTYQLSKHPEMQKKAREELDRVLIDKRRPTYEDYGKLNYINAIIAETLRYHPPVGAVIKTAKKDVKIGKFEIPKGTSVTMQIMSINNSEKIWDKPSIYNPDRFIDPEVRQKIQSDFSWIPFSMGARKCIGFQFAMLEACMILSRLLQFYEFELLNDESKEEDKIGEISRVTIRPTNLRVLVKHRSD